MNSDMNEISDGIPTREAENKFTLKVLFGHMFGCELHLPAEDYFLIINPGLALQDTETTKVSGTEHAAAYTHHTLYFPCDIPSPNIILRLSDSVEDEDVKQGYHLDVQSLENSYTALLKENEIFTHEHIRFAIKRSENQWSEDIKNFHLPPVVDSQHDDQETRASLQIKKKLPLAIGAISVAVLLITLAVTWVNYVEKEQQVLTLNEALTGAPTPLEIVTGREDNLIYVLSSEQQAIKWAQIAIIKLNKKNSVVPVWLTQQRQHVTSELTKAGYPVLQIDYARPQHPVISLYQAMSAEEKDKFTRLALKNIPFALDIDTRVKTKFQLLQDARQGLDRLHIHYRQINTSTGYALVVRDALSDNILAAIQRFTYEFTQQWGNSVINFSINLDENWLQDKSYLDSSNGYLFLNPQHWYFPLKKEI